jgi:hypothetical protein
LVASLALIWCLTRPSPTNLSIVFVPIVPVATAESDLDVTSGSIERDQQGQSNKYNYNYWSSPVSPSIRTNYTVRCFI